MSRPIRTRVPGLGLLALLFAAGPAASGWLRASEPLPVSGKAAVSVDNLSLLLHPLTGAPIALLADPAQQLPGDRRHLTLHTIREDAESSDLPLLRVTGVLPEFWAEPASWRLFPGGPGAYSGYGRDQRWKDWAGRPHTDRRAYPLDNGPGGRPLPAAPAPPGAGQLNLAPGAGSLSLSWAGAAGRVYTIEHTPDLSVPFRPVRTFINPRDGAVSVDLPTNERSGYYRVLETTP